MNCKECATQGKTCCQQRYPIHLTSGDIGRIEKETEISSHLFVDKPHPCSCSAGDFVWFVFTQLAPTLKKKEDSWDCIFLRDDGCSLPERVRPLICLLFPYNYDQNGLRGIGETMCRYPESFDEKAEAWRKQFYQEMEVKVMSYVKQVEGEVKNLR